MDKDGFVIRKSTENNKIPLLVGLETKNLETEERLNLSNLYDLEKINTIYDILESLELLDKLTEVEIVGNASKEIHLKFESEKKKVKLNYSSTDFRGQLLKVKEIMKLESRKRR